MGYILDYSNWRRIFEAEETKVNILFASTSAETMPNSTNVSLNGLIAPTDTTTYPDIEKTVFSAKVSDLFVSGKVTKKTLLSKFMPVRTTTTAMDVLKVGDQGGDYAQGGLTPSGGIQFMSNSTDTIEASHNGLLVVARALETFIDAGFPAGVKIMLKMGQASRWGAYIKLTEINKLTDSSIYGGWQTHMVAAIIPDGGFASNTYKTSYDGKTAEERIEILKGQWTKGWVNVSVTNRFPITTTTGPTGVDYSKWVNNYFGKITKLEDFETVAGLQTDFETMFKACRTHYYNAIKNDLYKVIVNKTGLQIPEMDDILVEINELSVSQAKDKAEPIMTSDSGAGVPIKSTSGKASTSQYDLGTAKN